MFLLKDIGVGLSIFKQLIFGRILIYFVNFHENSDIAEGKGSWSEMGCGQKALVRTYRNRPEAIGEMDLSIAKSGSHTKGAHAQRDSGPQAGVCREAGCHGTGSARRASGDGRHYKYQ